VTSALLSSLSKISAAHDDSPGTVESTVAAKRILQALRPALLVGISYYVGTRIGFAWTPIGQPNSTFWPANAILLAALLMAPRRTSWILLLVVLPTHMLAQLQAGVPVWTALGWFVTNTSEALIGAFCIARLTYPRNTLDNVRGVFTFVVFGVVLAPLATSFLDAAAVVITGWGRAFWPLGIERFWTNACGANTGSSDSTLEFKRHFMASEGQRSSIFGSSPARRWYSTGCGFSIRFSAFFAVYNSRTSVPSSTVFIMGCSPLWLGWIEPLSLIRRADLDQVHHARARAIPVRIHGTKRPVLTDSIMCGCRATDVPLGRHGRGATHARLPASDQW